GAALARDLNIQLVSNQPQYSLLYRVIEEEVIPASSEAGVSQVVWSPLAQGVLTGKYLPGEEYPAGSRAALGVANEWERNEFLRPEVLQRVVELNGLAEEAGVTTAQLSIAWVL